jgi:putative endonuclease
MSSYVVYIIFSPIRQKYYIGQTEDFGKRIERHNNGGVPSTKSGIPWEVIKTINCESRSSAILLETKIKKRGAKRFLEDNNYEV